VNNQTSTSIANTIPGGGVLAVGVSYTMYRSWGFTLSQIALSALVTGIWNIFMKLGLPVVALAILAIQGRASAALVTAALIGLLVLIGAILLFALMLWKKALAGRIGEALGRAFSAIRKLFRKAPVTQWGDAAVRFRKQTIKLVAKQWVPLTVSTVVSHIALFLVLLLALRHVGVSQQQVSWSEALGVYAFGRLITALPITPGGVGIVELGYIGGLVLAGGAKPEVVAAVLIFRALTYGLQIPLGGFTYLIWRANKSWRKAPPPEPADDIVTVGETSPATG
ncbi:MAG: YbhN family protein, partial [Actinomycetota bacterium]|nr:YbhN family protein [Actinomycetota bacterium]